MSSFDNLTQNNDYIEKISNKKLNFNGEIMDESKIETNSNTPTSNLISPHLEFNQSSATSVTQQFSPLTSISQPLSSLQSQKCYFNFILCHLISPQLPQDCKYAVSLIFIYIFIYVLIFLVILEKSK